MIFHPPSWLPAINEDISAAGAAGNFMLRGHPGKAFQASPQQPILTSAASRKSVSLEQITENVEALAAGLAHDVRWEPNVPIEGGKVIAILCENSINYLSYCWAIHRIGGTCLLLHVTNSPEESVKHLRDSGCNILVVSPATLELGRHTAAALNKPVHVYLTEAPTDGPVQLNGVNPQAKTLADILAQGRTLEKLPPLDLPTVGTDSDIAFLCSTSGTSGVQKLARLTHSGIIANVVQVSAHECTSRDRAQETALGILPMSHALGLIAAHGTVYLRDRLIVHTKFDMKASLGSVEVYKINKLYVIPSILVGLVSNPFLFKVFDLSSVKYIIVGAGGLSPELRGAVKAVQPSWELIAGFGITEGSVVVTFTSSREYVPSSCGTLMPLYQARLQRDDGSEVDSFDEAGELYLTSPSIAAGYVGDDESNATTFKDGWLRTGDVAVFRRSPDNDSHLFIVDRLRDMIKVKGMQVAPVAIEACLRKHPGVADVAVIGVPDNMAGERAKAFVVPAKPPTGEAETASLFVQLDDHVQGQLTEPHWIRGRYQILEALPRNATGKVSKGVLRKL